MNITISCGIKGAQQAEGITVIIDVLRAATVAAYLLDGSVESIVPVSTAEEAFAYQLEDPELILVGENKGIQILGFDYGNSPSEIQRADLAGKKVVHRSSTGTQGLVHAGQASEIIFGSFVTAGAIAKYIQEQQPEKVSLVYMEAHEDLLLAEYLEAVLLEREPKSMEAVVKELEEHPRCQWFLDPENELFPQEDFYLSLELDRFSAFPIVRNGEIISSSQM